ncbi:probable low affinity copper uptake protein 2 isoform X2 [Hemicordylus capensis]|uniref:probable low affinity copper uptake protein 2 isoform X2 n=1 Tax=Hemicordylus capensis TaxID=884348 RepID=UPI0023026C9E|nr:probable low affinity copper uptake protein 2 isoform X2 [Hemicordylus capensis]
MATSEACSLLLIIMYFIFSDKVVLLFDFWNVHSPGGMVLSVIVILLLAVLYEAIKVGKAKLVQRTMPTVAPSISQEALDEPERASVSNGLDRFVHPPKKWFLWHSVQTLIHIVQVVLGYLVMLAVMTYNTWIFLGVVAGSAIGYFLFYPLLNTR